MIGEPRSALRADETQELDASQTANRAEKQSLLLFRAGRFERLAVPLSSVARLEEFPHSIIERAVGGLVVQYRGQILSLVPLAAHLEGCTATTLVLREDPVQVVVFADGERHVGLLVDQIIDIVEDTVTIKKASNHVGLLGSAVIGQKITDFLDLHAVIQGTDEVPSVKKTSPGVGFSECLDKLALAVGAEK